MTVPNDFNSKTYELNGVATEFDTEFLFFDEDQINAYTVKAGVVTPLVLNTDFSVSGAGEPNGGSITYPISGSPDDNGDLIIERVLEVVQDTSLRNQGAYFPETVERAIDESRMIDQQQQDALDRSLKRPVGLDDWAAEGRRITGLGDATDDQDALTKGQSDQRFSDDVITKTGGHWDGKGLQARNFSTRTPPQNLDLMTFTAVKVYLASITDSVPDKSLTLESVQAMKDNETLFVGQYVETLSHQTPSDYAVFPMSTPYFGGANYVIVPDETGTDNNGSFIDLPGSGLQAKLLFTTEDIDVAVYGALPNADSLIPIQAAITDATTIGRPVTLGNKSYEVSRPLQISASNFKLKNGRLGPHEDFSADGSGSEFLVRLVSGTRNSLESIFFSCGFVSDGFVVEANGFLNEFSHIEVDQFKSYGSRYLDGGGIKVDGCTFTQSAEVTERTGIGMDVQTADIKVTNTISRYSLKPLVADGNTGLYTACHFYNGSAGSTTPANNSINVEINSGGGQTFTGCYIDKGRVILKRFDSQWVGTKYLFDSSPDHDSIFVFDAGDVNRNSLDRFVHESSYSTVPVNTGAMRFAEFIASGSGSWTSDISEIADVAFAEQRSFNINTRETVKVIGGETWYKGADGGGVQLAAGAGGIQPVFGWESGEVSFYAPGVTTKSVGEGTATTGSLRSEGSRTSIGGTAAQLEMADRRGSDDRTLSDTALSIARFEWMGAGGTDEGRLRLMVSNPGSASFLERFVWASTVFRSGEDNAQTLGSGSFRWSEVYSANGTINTSDEREKQQIRDLSDEENAVAKQLKCMVRAFKWNRDVDEHGEKAQWQFGVIAQQVRDVFIENGLDPMEYGVLRYDEWPDEWIEEADADNPTLLVKKKVRESGGLWGVKYDQLLAFIISAM